MDYELAKQLKDAGFKFTSESTDGKWDIINTTRPENLTEKSLVILNNVLYRVPTLSELIEACGEEFLSLDSPEVSDSYKDGMDWCATGIKGGQRTFTKGGGKTPEEAVAKLWLKLNKKLSTDTIDNLER